MKSDLHSAILSTRFSSYFPSMVNVSCSRLSSCTILFHICCPKAVEIPSRQLSNRIPYSIFIFLSLSKLFILAQKDQNMNSYNTLQCYVFKQKVERKKENKGGEKSKIQEARSIQQFCLGGEERIRSKCKKDLKFPALKKRKTSSLFSYSSLC